MSIRIDIKLCILSVLLGSITVKLTTVQVWIQAQEPEAYT
jgi:hypothetical protein